MYSFRVIEESRANEKAPFETIPTTYGIGGFYSVLKKGSTGKFEEKMKKDYPEFKINEIRGIVVGANGVELFLMEDSVNNKAAYFIMTDTGSTLEKL